jgi:DNA-binding MarR family transcriptional regulator
MHLMLKTPSPSAALPDISTTCVCFHLRRSARAITQLYDHILAPSGLRATQYTLLTVVRRTGGLTFSGLAELLGMDRTTLTRNLRPLERDGLVKIETGADRRVRLVQLTRLGERKHEAAEPLWTRAHNTVINGIGEKTWKTLRQDLSRTIAVGLQATAEQESQ